MMAYSSINHAGFISWGAGATVRGCRLALLLFAYTFMVLGVFA